MTLDDRTVLIRQLELLEAHRPEGARAWFRWKSDIRKLKGLLEWEDARRDGIDELRRSFRRAGAVGFGGLWIASFISSIMIGDIPLTPARVAGSAFVSLFVLGLGLLWLEHFLAKAWRTQEEELARTLAGLRGRDAALPTPRSDAPAVSPASLPSSR